MPSELDVGGLARAVGGDAHLAHARLAGGVAVDDLGAGAALDRDLAARRLPGGGATGSTLDDSSSLGILFRTVLGRPV